jgi:hypothetical protein
MRLSNDNVHAGAAGYEWDGPDAVVEVPDALAAELLHIPGGGYRVVPDDEEGDGESEKTSAPAKPKGRGRGRGKLAEVEPPAGVTEVEDQSDDTGNGDDEEGDGESDAGE